MTAHSAIASAMAHFDRQLAVGRAHRLHEPGLKLGAMGGDFVTFHSIEYGGNLCEKEIETARDEVRRAIQTFFSMEDLIVPSPGFAARAVLLVVGIW
jgi:hypothetical protein